MNKSLSIIFIKMAAFKFLHVKLMKSFLLAGLMFFLATTSIAAQSVDTINQTDELGRKQGFWRKTDNYGRKVYEGRFADDIPTGNFRYYYDDGRLKALSRVSDDGKNSWTITYHNNGREMSEGAYKNQLKDSVWTFYDVYGQVLTTETYKEGVLQGKFVTFYQSGDTTEILYYKNGLKHGDWKQFYKGGQLKTSGMYVNDTLHDSITFFHKNGKIMLAGKYCMGMQEGTWCHYSETGQMEKKEHFEDGMKTGQETLIEFTPKKEPQN